MYSFPQEQVHRSLLVQQASYHIASSLSLLLYYFKHHHFLSLLWPFDLHLACRWFCEGKELHNTPDIQIHCEGEDLHTLVIAEAFEDDTGRYTCLATNPSGSETTSAEIFIEGKERCVVKECEWSNSLSISKASWWMCFSNANSIMVWFKPHFSCSMSWELIITR